MNDDWPSGPTRADYYEDLDDVPYEDQHNDTIGDVIGRRYGRRDILRGGLGVAAVTTLFGVAALQDSEQDFGASGTFSFREIQAGLDDDHHVPEGYVSDILLRWGDGIFPNSPPFDPSKLSAEAQARQFGYNNDFVGFIPLEGSSERGLLCVNHEYTIEELMFSEMNGSDQAALSEQEQIDIEMAAHGGTIVEIRLKDGRWQVEKNSGFNRRITASGTVFSLDGPAVGHERMKTIDDKTGRVVVGTVNNCAGGITPWGTFLMAEENFHGYFWTAQRDKKGKPKKGLGGKQAESYKIYGIPSARFNWGRYHSRFNVDFEANEPNRFGWIVEVDPLEPGSTPVKHTALGRFFHEGSECILNKDGRAVVYSGDDRRFEFIYRFVSEKRFDPNDRAANKKLLSRGTLSVARFNDDGTMTWMPLVFGEGPLNEDHGFRSQADVMIDVRIAARLLGATAMDRPEDVQPNPKTGKVYAMLTNNNKRKPSDVDAANPRAENYFGHIIEMTTPDGDHAADTYRWEILLQCGDPRLADVGALWHPDTSENGWFAAPDNCAIDDLGRLWVSTDQGDKGFLRTGRADGLYAVETDGELRGKSKLFFRCPSGAELCGPYFGPSDETLFVAVQHPVVRWPDFKTGMPPRPSVVAIRRKDGGRIG